MYQTNSEHKESVRFIDLFCGIGGFRTAIQNVANLCHVSSECVFSSDIDGECQKAYAANYGEWPTGDITKIEASQIPDHDILLAGFPCQPFSIIGQMRGFEDTRGTLFFDIARILEAKRPRAFVLENVKLLAGHNKGQTLKIILRTLAKLGYHTEFKVLNALNFGLPHKRERIWIVGFLEPKIYNWPTGGFPMRPLSKILDRKVPKSYYASEHIRTKRLSAMKPTKELTIWHENKAGHISAYPYSCALRAGASYNYLLVNGERRLTPREMLRLQGFSDNFTIVCSDTQTRKQAGNSLPVNVAQAVLLEVFKSLELGSALRNNYSAEEQLRLLEKNTPYNAQTKTTHGGKIPTTLSAKSTSK